MSDMAIFQQLRAISEMQDSVVREINPYSNEPYRERHQPKVTASPPLLEADICSPSKIQQGKKGENRKNEKRPDEGLPCRGMQSKLALLRDCPTGRSRNQINDGAYYIYYEQS
jgi:hypothetical protein